MTETYKDIPGYPGYRVGSFGTVWSSWKRGKCGYGWKQLKPSKHKQGYLYVDLYKEGVKSRFLVHTLVLTSFVGPCPLGMECRHLDRNVANNHDWNLKWGTPTENQQDRVLHGTSNRGEQHGRAFLSDADVLDMRQKWATKQFTQEQLSEIFHVTPAYVSDIVNNRVRKVYE